MSATLDVDRLAEMPRRSAALFAVSCASRLRPLFVAFARDSRPHWDAWLGSLWTAIAHNDRTAAVELRNQLETAPESHVDDSNRPDYYAMRVLGVLAYAVSVLLDDDYQKATEYCSRSATAVLRDLQFIINQDGYYEPITDLEVQAENRDINDLLQDDDPDVSSVRQRASGSTVTSGLAGVPDIVARVHDWDLTAW